MKTLSYNGYQAAVEFEDGQLFVRVLHIQDLLVGECDAASEAQKIFEGLIDAYLEDCLELGKEPDKPFKGTFNIRVAPELHRQAAMLAAEQGVTLNKWVSTALEEKLQAVQHTLAS
ncbi:type II toxin-antitoxin system HicB family antitoxin [Neorhizobium alkalisoli]|uniref:Putative HicB family RNase H-like nuclease n=1 Tax=Neorhizobium alkalisoli TaxID=528178 RepID=A0A561QS58_9HYPH|nr:type II toxin-antitoxin system HicB family antitoxin [Neorhizobium alkalisoli]TWF53179.1 putative HicB family RNase H-like nuclease [Neorhizobium alkalisoli]